MRRGKGKGRGRGGVKNEGRKKSNGVKKEGEESMKERRQPPQQ